MPIIEFSTDKHRNHSVCTIAYTVVYCKKCTKLYTGKTEHRTVIFLIIHQIITQYVRMIKIWLIGFTPDRQGLESYLIYTFLNLIILMIDFKYAQLLKIANNTDVIFISLLGVYLVLNWNLFRFLFFISTTYIVLYYAGL